MPSSGFLDTPDHLYRVDKTARVQMLNNPHVLGTGQYTSAGAPDSREFQTARGKLNLDLAWNDRLN
jgi:hypothetical protein